MFKIVYRVATMRYGLSAITFLASLGFALSSDRVVCYLGTWSVYRPGNGQFEIEDIDPNLCTHLIYSFVGINEDASIRILDRWLDIDLDGYGRFNALRKINSNLKTLIAIGGWNEGSEVFSRVTSSPHLRTAFVNNAAEFVKTHGFDGFDLDWEYPSQRGGAPEDKHNFGLLLKEFRQVFNQHGYLLTAAVGASSKAINISYDVPILSENLDFINVMTYDLHGPWDKATGQNAPLYPAPHETTEEERELNVEACINAWIRNGANPEKLVLGMGTYGRAFTLDNAANNGLNASASQPGRPGPYTGEAGMLGYNEICELQMSQPWTVVWNEPQKVPYAFLGNQWVGYDNPMSIALKMEFAKSLGLGGAMIWSVETDDFRGICGTKYPILTAINANL